MILNGDALHIPLEDKTVQTCGTSPPYYGLRNYGVDGQIGLEETPEAYVEKMVDVFREVKRVLRDDGTCWLNLGDSYAGGNQTGRNDGGRPEKGRGWAEYDIPRTKLNRHDGAKTKDLIGIPWMVAFALRADGWYLRSDIIWHKPNPMPESVTDRPTKAHEYLFLLSKQPRYYYDAEAIKEPSAESSIERYKYPRFGPGNKAADPDSQYSVSGGDYSATEKNAVTRNRRSVWTVPTKPYSAAHFATYPPKLIEPCILAGTSERGQCPECGKAWERVVDRGELISGNRHTRVNNRIKQDETNFDAWSRPNGLGATQVPGAFYENKTLGWRPGCECYGLEIVPDQPKKPGKKKDESEAEYKIRLDEWQARLEAWYQKWETLKPLYNACDTVPQIVLDPFSGSGTTGEVALHYHRRYVGLELNMEYIGMSRERTTVDVMLPGLNVPTP